MKRNRASVLTHPDALTHADALLYMTPMRVRTRARAPLYRDLCQSASVRQSPSEAGGEEVPLSTFLAGLADRVRYLSPSHRDPEAFHEAKSEIEADLRRLARVLPAEDVYGRRKRSSSLDEADLSPKVPGLRKG